MGPTTGEPRRDTTRARSFDQVVDSYDRARPSYPVEAARWLTGPEQASVLELGAGTGKLTEQLVALGHPVTATDPSEPMLRRLTERVPAARPVLAAAERIPLASRSADLVVAGTAFHWFDAETVLPEIARVLKPRGVLGLVWNARDERVPWVRRLGAIIGESEHESDPTRAVDDSGLFETVQTSTFRFWQQTSRQSLRELVLSRSKVAVLSPPEREPVLRKVDELYDEYGRGHDGMLLPYLTHAYRAVVLPWAVREKADSHTASRPSPTKASPASEGPEDLGTESLLIDFH